MRAARLGNAEGVDCHTASFLFSGLCVRVRVCLHNWIFLFPKSNKDGIEGFTALVISVIVTDNQ